VARDGVEAVLRERLASLYPSMRWARRAGDRLDFHRAATEFPVWAPDAGPELDRLLTAMRAHIAELEQRTSRAGDEVDRVRHELDTTRKELAATETHLAAVRGTRTFRIQQRVARVVERIRKRATR
jgi:hypothetical protein